MERVFDIHGLCEMTFVCFCSGFMSDCIRGFIFGIKLARAR